MDTTSEKRESYSFFEFPSLHCGRRIRLDSRTLERTLIELETTPGVAAWQKVDQQVPFGFEGKQRLAVLQLLVSRRHPDGDSAWQRVQLVRGTGSHLEEAALVAGREFCERQHVQHVALHANRATAGPYELRNRTAAHAWLLQARERSTRLLEQRLVQQVSRQPVSLSELSQLLDLTPLQTRLVFIRCWLRQLVGWDIGYEPIGHDLQVNEASHG